jgi:hypothetical protein
MDVEKLVLAVEREPQLYNFKLSVYADKQLRENTWRKIGDEFGTTGKWFYLFISSMISI